MHLLYIEIHLESKFGYFREKKSWNFEDVYDVFDESKALLIPESDFIPGTFQGKESIFSRTVGQ